MTANRVVLGDNLDAVRLLDAESVDLIYVDPPFNTGGYQTMTRLRTTHDPDGTRVGYQGRRYTSVKVGTTRYQDTFDDYLAFLEPRLREFRRVLSNAGLLYFHVSIASPLPV
ncbi:MAG: DNA methyltransferase [Chloroflexota bacterium]